MKILLITFYELRESLLYAAEELIKLNHQVTYYPLFKYMNDKFSKLDNWFEHFCDHIQTENPNVILWWYHSIETEYLEKITIKFTHIKNILFNWDDPYNWTMCDMANKSKFYDIAFITCSDSMKDYINAGCKKAVYLLPGYNPKIHYMTFEDDTNYTCDISFCCTNLYENDDEYPNQIINRKKLIDLIYNNQTKYGYVFNIYGPEFLRNLYPDSYKWMANYNETNKIFNNSKINLCTHVLGNRKGYVNERVILILGSGGLLLVDNIDGIVDLFQENNDIIVYDGTNILEKISQILNNYDEMYKIRLNGNIKSRNYTYEKWAKTIHENIINL